jgi:hypothetical protein
VKEKAQRREAELQAQIHSLKYELQNAAKPVVQKEPVIIFPDEKLAEIQETIDLFFSDFAKGVAQVQDTLSAVQESEGKIELLVTDLRKAIPETEVPTQKVLPAKPAPVLPATVTTRPILPREAKLNTATPTPNGHLSTLQKQILGGAALLHTTGIENPSIAQVAATIGKGVNAGPVRGAFNFLHDNGYAEIAGSQIRLTGLGRDVAVAPNISSRADIHNLWYQRLTGNELEFFRVLIGTYPAAVSRTELCDALGKNENAGPIRGALNALVDKGLAQVDADVFIASDVFFPEGLV